jgi:hypothetical protein
MENHFKSRLIDLEDHVKQDLELLKKYEDALRYEDDPRRSTRYQNEINKLKTSSDRYSREYQELQPLLKQQPYLEIDSLINQLDIIQDGINKLRMGQRIIFSNINSLRASVLSKFDNTEQNIISTVLSKIDDSELSIVNLIIDAIDKSQLSDIEGSQINSITEAVNKIQIDDLPVEAKNIIELLKSPELDNKHKLILTIPIVPMILSYESEIEIGSGINIGQAWRMLSKRFKGDK